MKIEKKIWPKFFKKIKSGEKTFELRLADWKCKPGDILILREWDPEFERYTGKKAEKKVTFVLRTRNVHLFPKKDVAKYGYQIISLK